MALGHQVPHDIVANIPSVAAAMAAVASQPRERQTAGSAMSPTTLRCDAATMTMTGTMIGTEMTVQPHADFQETRHRIGGRTRQHRQCQQSRPDDAQPEQQEGELAGDRFERLRGRGVVSM